MNKTAVIQSLIKVFTSQQKVLNKLAESLGEDDSIDVDLEEPSFEEEPFDPSKGEVLVKKWTNGDDAIMLIDGRRVKGKVANINKQLNAGMFHFIDPRTNKPNRKLIDNLDDLIVPQDW